MDTYSIHKILVPIDFSLTSLKALDQARFIARKTNAEITLVHVMNSVLSGDNPLYFTIPRSAEYEGEMFKACEKEINRLADKIRQWEAVTVKTKILSGNTKHEVLKAAEETEADLIVMGTHGTSGIKEFVKGSNTVRIISEAKCPVLSVQQAHEPGFKKILVPFRNRPHSREKINYAMSVAKLFGSSIYVLGIDVEDDEEVRHKLKLEAKQIKGIVEHKGLKCEIQVITGSYLSEEILEHAKEADADLVIVMSDLDKRSISDYIMGPFAQQVVNHSHIPILSIHPTFNAEMVNLKGYGW